MKNIFVFMSTLGIITASMQAGAMSPFPWNPPVSPTGTNNIKPQPPAPPPAPLVPQPPAPPPPVAKPTVPPPTVAQQPVVQQPANPLQPTTIVNAISNASVLLTDKVFSSQSFWYTPIPTTVKYHPNNTNLVNEFNRQRVKYFNTVDINTKSWTSPVYTVPANQPTVSVGWNDCQKKGYADKAFLAQVSAVPIPNNAVLGGGTDKEMSIYQPSTDTLWELWVANKNANNQWTACWGGKLANASRSNGTFPKGYGTTASGLPFIGGQITAEELQRGEIKHAIGISLVEIEHFTIYSYPANRSDGWNPTKIPNRIAEGQRFRLDPTLNVDALPLTRAGKIIAKAGQKYGFIVWDRAGAISIRAQNPNSYASNPYPALFDGKPSYEILKNLPWNRIQFLPFDYGKPS